MKNPNPYWWAPELSDRPTPRTVNFQDIYRMCCDGVFKFNCTNMRTLDVRLTTNKYTVKFEAYDVFDSTHLQQRAGDPNRRGRKPKRVYKGRVANHKSLKHSSKILNEFISTYMQKELDRAGKQAVQLGSPQVFQTETFKLIQNRFKEIFESVNH